MHERKCHFDTRARRVLDGKAVLVGGAEDCVGAAGLWRLPVRVQRRVRIAARDLVAIAKKEVSKSAVS